MSLRQIFKKEFNKVVDKQVDIDFDLDRDAFYLVKVTARAWAWWQRLPPMSKDHWADEELKVVVDSTPLNLKFNGNNLWGTHQFIFLLQHLSAGSHIISLINKHKPFLEAVEVYQVEDFSGIDLLPITEQKPEDTFLNTFIGRSKPWVTVHSQGSAITGIQIDAKAEKSPLPLVTDDEDLQSRWGQTYHNVILAEDQYDSFWNPRTFNKVRNPPVADPAEKEAWEESYNSAGSIIGGKVADPTNGANHFYATTISKPDWATDDKFTIQIGITRFYKL